MKFPMKTESKQSEVNLSGVTKTYSVPEGKKTACRNINFSASKGEITGILGKNGAGKSTLIKIICAFQYPTTGKVLVCDTEDPVSIRRNAGYVSETPCLEQNLTVNEILYFNASLYCNSEEEINNRIKKSVEVTEIKDVVNVKASALSKGYAQRVNLAKTLCTEPSVLVLDEFSGGLDPVQTKKLRMEIKKLSAGKTIIISTHSIEEAAFLCDRIYIMKDGLIAASGTQKELQEQTGTDSLENAFIKTVGEKI